MMRTLTLTSSTCAIRTLAVSVLQLVREIDCKIQAFIGVLTEQMATKANKAISCSVWRSRVEVNARGVFETGSHVKTRADTESLRDHAFLPLCCPSFRALAYRVQDDHFANPCAMDAPHQVIALQTKYRFPSFVRYYHFWVAARSFADTPLIPSLNLKQFARQKQNRRGRRTGSERPVPMRARCSRPRSEEASAADGAGREGSLRVMFTVKKR